jgi:putative transposase
VYVYAAVCPQLGTMTALVLPYPNAQMMNMFLRHVAQAFAAYMVVMLLDRAPWHPAGTLLVPDNMRGLHQPAASPELNPTELVWRELREKDLPHHASETLSRVEDDLGTGLHRLAAAPEGLRSLTGFAYLNITP